MFQSFTSPDHKPFIKQRVGELQALCKKHKIDGFLVPHADAFNNEYLPECYKRLEFMTGFTGSWGMALIMPDKAYLCVDSRYKLQAPQETDTSIYEVICISDVPFKKFFSSERFADQIIGYDAALNTQSEIDRFTAYLPQSATLKPIDQNLVDQLPKDHVHALPQTPIIIHDIKYAGKTAQEKLDQISTYLKENALDSAVIALPESLCWLLNLRAKDVLHTPYILSYGILHQNGALDWFVNPSRITDVIADYLPPKVTPYPLDDFYMALSHLKGKVQNDHKHNNAKIYQTLKSNPHITKIVNQDDPCLLPKAIKNATEIQATKVAHLRDAIAIIRFIIWLEASTDQNITEIDCVKKLEACRRDTGHLQDISFDTISGTGAHGAIVHYRVTEASNQTLKQGDLFLLDSGGQYFDGTTDITRTFAIGTPTQEMRMRYTQVLKGHLGIAMAKFPPKTTGATLDVLARMPLWQAGIDYGHGTGHGVGVYLGVHEGPQSISSRSTIALEVGMILSNEPGYYKENAFGIRIENLEVVTEAAQIEQGEQPMMGFETLTMVPYASDLIDKTYLNAPEIAHINQYHQNILNNMQAHLSDHEYQMLEKMCQPL